MNYVHHKIWETNCNVIRAMLKKRRVCTKYIAEAFRIRVHSFSDDGDVLIFEDEQALNDLESIVESSKQVFAKLKKKSLVISRTVNITTPREQGQVT